MTVFRTYTTPTSFNQMAEENRAQHLEWVKTQLQLTFHLYAEENEYLSRSKRLFISRKTMEIVNQKTFTNKAKIRARSYIIQLLKKHQKEAFANIIQMQIEEN